MSRELKKKRVSLFYYPDTNTENRICYLNPPSGEKDLEEVTAFLPPDLEIIETEAGFSVILCPDGTELTEITLGACNKKPQVPYIKPRTGKPHVSYLDVLNPETRMKIVAYRRENEQRMPTWSINKIKDSEPVELYLPNWTKLIEEGRERYIEFPSTGGEKVDFSDRRQVYVPHPALWIKDFDGIGMGGVPYIMYGNERRPCHLAQPGDRYQAIEPTRTITRLEETLWRVDTLHCTRKGTQIITRIYCNDIRPYELNTIRKPSK